jgi:hypothetical protein
MAVNSENEGLFFNVPLRIIRKAVRVFAPRLSNGQKKTVGPKGRLPTVFGYLLT